MDVKELKRIIRNDFNLYIRNLVIKDTCEKCNTKNNLEVHHTYPLSLMMQETLEVMNIDDVESLSEDEIKTFREIMLGKQIKIKYKTLCVDCHKLIDDHDLLTSRRYTIKELESVKCNKHLAKCVEEGIVSIDCVIPFELNKTYIKEDFMALFKDLKDKNNNNWGIKRIKSELNKNGYEVTQVRKTIKGKRDRYYTITLKNE
jgi:hypothetical protein